MDVDATLIAYLFAGATVASVALALRIGSLTRRVLRSDRIRLEDRLEHVELGNVRGSRGPGADGYVVPSSIWIRGWPFIVRPVSTLIGPLVPVRMRGSVQRQLRRAGLDDDFSPQHVIAASICWGALSGFLAAVSGLSTLLASLSAGIGMVLPWVSLRDLCRRQSLQVARELPGYVEMLTLALEAGGALSVALRVATDRARDGVLRRGFLKVQGDIRAGRTRTDALRALAERFEEPAIVSLVAALVQAETSGASLAGVLRAQTEQRLNERFTRAEKQALEAPVKMLGPLVLCIFPCTFLMLAFPVVVRFL